MTQHNLRSFFRPLRGLANANAVSQGCADLPWATCFRPLRGLLRLFWK